MKIIRLFVVFFLKKYIECLAFLETVFGKIDSGHESNTTTICLNNFICKKYTVHSFE